MSTSTQPDSTLTFEDSKINLHCTFSFFSYTHGEDNPPHLRHLNLLLHGDFSSNRVLYPQPDTADLREFFDGQTVLTDGASFPLSGVSDGIEQWLAEIKQRHGIEGKSPLLVADGRLSLVEIADMLDLFERHGIDCLPVAYYDDRLADHVGVSLWWFDRRKWSWGGVGYQV